MVFYNCIECNFITDKKCNYQRHFKTSKHQNKINKKLKCKKEEFYDENIIKLLLKEKDERIKDNQRYLNLIEKIQEKTNQPIINHTETIYNQNINTQVNNTNYVLNYINFQTADTMESIKQKFRLTKDEYIKASLSNGYRGALLDKANNIIIKPYLDKKNKRPIQTVDCSRRKALFKDLQHDNWTFYPKTNLEHCFKEFHISALEQQNITIRNNPYILLSNNEIDDNLYKQTYFVPTEEKEKINIYRDISNHIYKKTKVLRNTQIDDVIKYLES